MGVNRGNWISYHTPVIGLLCGWHHTITCVNIRPCGIQQSEFHKKKILNISVTNMCFHWVPFIYHAACIIMSWRSMFPYEDYINCNTEVGNYLCVLWLCTNNNGKWWPTAIFRVNTFLNQHLVKSLQLIWRSEMKFMGSQSSNESGTWSSNALQWFDLKDIAQG